MGQNAPADGDARNMTDDDDNSESISGVQYEESGKRRVWTMYHNIYCEVGVRLEERTRAGVKRKRIEVW